MARLVLAWLLALSTLACADSPGRDTWPEAEQYVGGWWYGLDAAPGNIVTMAHLEQEVDGTVWGWALTGQLHGRVVGRRFSFSIADIAKPECGYTGETEIQRLPDRERWVVALEHTGSCLDEVPDLYGYLDRWDSLACTYPEERCLPQENPPRPARCANLENDPDDCGVCGAICPEGEVCEQRFCR